MALDMSFRSLVLGVQVGLGGSTNLGPQQGILLMSSLCLKLFGHSVLMQQMPTNPLQECIMCSAASNAQILSVAQISTARAFRCFRRLADVPSLVFFRRRFGMLTQVVCAV